MTLQTRRKFAFALLVVILLIAARPVCAAPPDFKPLRAVGSADALKPGSSTFDVTPTGEAVWSMPLWTPSGRNGIEPQLALTYRSRGDNGIVGLHFAIDGLAAITRCWATPAQDGGYATGIVRGLPDKFCLNGQRLITRPGAPQFELQPELDPSIVVRVGGTSPSNPEYFSVFYADGRIARFGYRNLSTTKVSSSVVTAREMSITAPIDSNQNFTTDKFDESFTIASPQRNLVWNVDRIEDHYGNYMEIDYQRDVESNVPGAVEVVPKEIRWTGYGQPTGTTAAPADPSRRIEFIYAQSPKRDVRVGYQGGLAVKRSKLLERIRVIAQDGIVSDANAPVPGSNKHVKSERVFREYRFTYQAALPGYRSTDRLESVRECVYASATVSQCLDPLEFVWTRETEVPQFSPAQTLTDVVDLPVDVRGHVPWFAGDVYDMVVGDFDGDGRDDIVYRLPAMANGRFRDVDGNDPYQAADPQDPFANVPPNTVGRGDWFMRRGVATGLGPRFPLNGLPPTPGGDWKFSPRVLDVGGDGSAELILYSEPIGSTATPSPKQYRGFSFNCTGGSCDFSPISSLTEITEFPLIQGYPRRSFSLQTGDLNGDGKIDFVHENASALQTGGDPTTLSFRAGVPGQGSTFLPKVTMKIPNPPPPSNGNIVTRLFDERYMVDTDGNSQPELLTLTDDAAPVQSPRPYTFSALTLNGSRANGEARILRTTLHAADVEASDVIGSLIGRAPCRPPEDPLLHGILTDPDTGQPFRAYSKLKRYFIDINGDGLRDSVAAPSEPRDRCPSATQLPSTLFVSLNTGAAFRKPFSIPLTAQTGFNSSVVQFYAGYRSIDPGVRVADLDGDGREDFLLISKNEFQVRRAGDMSNRNNVVWLRSTGSGFASHELSISASLNTRTDNWNRQLTYGPRLAQVGDFNGDGLLDFVIPNDNNLTVTLQTPRLPDVVISIKGGPLTPSRAINYARASITSSDVYSKGQCAWPQVCLKTLGWVVKSTSVEALDFGTPTPTQTFTNYSYENARTDVLGRGMLGVDKVVRTVTDGGSSPKIFSTETLEFDVTTQVCQDQNRRMCAYVYAGSPKRRMLEIPISPTRVSTSQSETERRLAALPGGFGYRPTQQVNTTYGWETITGQTSTRKAIRATRSTTGFDTYGNIVSNISEVSGNELPLNGSVAPGQIIYRTERRTVGSQTPDEGKWLIYRYRVHEFISKDPTLPQREVELKQQQHVEYEPASVEVKSVTSEPKPTTPESNTVSGFTLKTDIGRDERGNIVSVIKSGSGKQRRLTFSFDGNDRDRIFPVSVTDGLNHSGFIYNHAALGVPVAVDDPNGIRTEYEYDSLGRIKTIRPAGTAPTTFLYLTFPNSALGGPRSWSECYRVGSGGGCQAFDLAGRLIASQEDGFDIEARTTFTYDRFGRLLKKSLPFSVSFGQANAFVEYDRDGLGRVTTMRRPGETPQSSVPINCRPPRRIQTPSGLWIWDPGNCPQILQPQAPPPVISTLTYDGLRVTSTSERGIKTVSDLDAKGRLVRQSTVEPSTSRDVETSYEYGHFDLPRTINHPVLPTSQMMSPNPAPLITKMSYDSLGRLESFTDPDAGTEEKRYNAFGEVKRTEDANGGITTYSYDEVGRVKLVETPATAFYPSRVGNSWAQRTEFIYDNAPNGIGQIAHIESNDGITKKFEYDSSGRPKAISWTIPGEPDRFRFSYDYNSLGQLQYLTYPQNGAQPFRLQYTYADNGQIRDVLNVSDPSKTSVIWHQIARDAAGNSTEEQFGQTAKVTRKYDSSYQLKLVLGEFISDGAMFQQLAYRWENDALLKSRTDLNPAMAVRETYTNDFLGRLERWNVEQNCQTTAWKYNYDDLGNLRMRETQSGLSFPSTRFDYTLPTDSTRPHAVKQVKTGPDVDLPTYDSAGQMSTGRGNTYTWSPIGLPWKVSAKAGLTQTLLHEGTGARIVSEVKTSQGTQRTITLDGLYELRTFGRPAVSERVYNIVATDGIIAQVRRSKDSGETMQFIHRDHLGNPDAVTTESIDAQGRPVGTLVERAKYEPFGERRFPWAIAHPMRQLHSMRASQGFTGHEPDDSFGLINMRGRVYDPGLARFVSSDPLFIGGDSQSLNRFSYVWNSPMNFTDPSGYKGKRDVIRLDDIPIEGRVESDPDEWEPYKPSGQSCPDCSKPPLVAATTDENSNSSSDGSGSAGDWFIGQTKPFAMENEGSFERLKEVLRPQAPNLGTLGPPETRTKPPFPPGTPLGVQLNHIPIPSFISAVISGDPKEIGAVKLDAFLSLLSAEKTDALKGFKAPWGTWNDYPKVIVNGQELAVVGNRFYQRHAVDRMQPSGLRYSTNQGTGGYPQIHQAGSGGPQGLDYGRSVSPTHAEYVIRASAGVVQENFNISHRVGDLQVIVAPGGRVITIITH